MVRLAVIIRSQCVSNNGSYTSSIIPKDKCGYAIQSITSGGRIVSGKDVEGTKENGKIVHGHPWMARLSKTIQAKSTYCGGTIISKRHILTAAHCMVICKRRKKCTPGYVSCKIGGIVCKHRGLEWAVLGDHDRRTWNEGEIYAKIKYFTVHPKMNQPLAPDGSFEYDFAVVGLRKCIDFTSNIQPICLPNNTTATYEGKNVTVIGWGHQRYREDKHELAGKHPHILKYITIKVFSNAWCKKQSSSFNPSYLMCAGDPIKWEKDACQDDSGGS